MSGGPDSRFAAAATLPPLEPLFLFSLPRSGSTLTQRVLAAHSQVATASEPSFLLPWLYSLREFGVHTEYWHRGVVQAVRDFTRSLPNGEEDYLAEIRRSALALYARAADGPARYFVDKTPRYHFIAEEILRLFPDARIIVLWRHPFSVVASMMETWRKGKWDPDYFDVDLHTGVDNLVRLSRRAGDRAIRVRYEDLLMGGEAAWRPVCDHLGLDWEPGMLERFGSVALARGDNVGRARYQALSTEPLDKWKRQMANPVRQWWCRRYLDWLCQDDRLREMGYEPDVLAAELDSISTTTVDVASDLAHMAIGRLRRPVRAAALYGRPRYLGSV